MPYVGRLVRRLIHGQGGSSLVELLVAMPLAILVLGVVFQGFAVGAQDQQRVEARSEAVIQAQQGLERMTRALRQANWVHFRSSDVVDVDTMVRPSPSAPAVRRLVRFDCSSRRCLRLEGPATFYPPPVSPVFERSQVLIGADPGDPADRGGHVENFDVFSPQRLDPVTGATETDYYEPDLLNIRLRLRPSAAEEPFELVDGVSLRNRRGES